MAITKLTRVQQIARALGMTIKPVMGDYYRVTGGKFGCALETPHQGIVIDALVDEIEMHEAAIDAGVKTYALR